MSTLVLYTPQKRLLDLAKLTERDFALISSLQYTIKRGYRTLLCQRASIDDGSRNVRSSAENNHGGSTSRYVAEPPAKRSGGAGTPGGQVGAAALEVSSGGSRT